MFERGGSRERRRARGLSEATWEPETISSTSRSGGRVNYSPSRQTDHFDEQSRHKCFQLNVMLLFSCGGWLHKDGADGAGVILISPFTATSLYSEERESEKQVEEGE